MHIEVYGGKERNEGIRSARKCITVQHHGGYGEGKSLQT